MSITLKDLEIKDVEFILAALSKGEYSLVAPVIEKIKIHSSSSCNHASGS
jgi:hypothetical protein